MTPIPSQLQNPGPNDQKVNHSNSAAWAISANTILRKKINALHLRDEDDIEHHISSLRNALLQMPGQDQDQVHMKSPFVPRAPMLSNSWSNHTLTPMIIFCSLMRMIRPRLAVTPPEV
jgi:hypothetical protein